MNELEQALTVRCSYCDAKVGEACRTFMGTIDRTGNPHSVRIMDGRRAAKEREKASQTELL
jgi:hypothetical protein